MILLPPWQRLALPCVALLLVAKTGIAQITSPDDTLAVARTLRDGGRFDVAARLLHPYVVSHPEDPRAAQLLAETLYWLQDRPGARAIYESAIAHHPSDAELRLAYGRMLIETRGGARARQLLTPLVGSAESRGRAETTLGTLAYWEGDYSTARRLFQAALAADSMIDAARTALREILIVTAPRVHLTANTLHDDQSLDRVGLEIEASAFVTPLVGISARAEPIRFRTDDGATHSLTIANGGISAYIPAARLELAAAAGGIQRTDGSTWLGRLGFGFRMPNRVVVRGRVERSPYLHTLASLTTPVVVETVGGTLDWNHSRGWLAQAAATAERFADDNVIGTGYVWLLAPLVHSAGLQMQLGYAFTAQGAERSRYVLVPGSGVPGPGAPATRGVYDPYYTPLDLRAHSALANAVVVASSRVTLRLGGAYGAARERAPSVERRSSMPPQPPTDVVVFRTRSFAPWSARMSVDAGLGRGFAVSASGEVMRTAFYRTATARLAVTRTFSTPALRRLEGR